MDIAPLARTYGYPVILLGTALQGEAVLLAGGFLAQQGYLSLFLVWFLGSLGGTTGDQTYFFLGRAYGDRLINRLPAGICRSLKAARRLVDRNPRKVLLYMRFLFGMRILLPILAGTSSIRTPRFMRYNILTSGVWSGIFVGVGYVYGAAAERFLARYKNVEWIALGALVVAGLAYHWIGRHLHGHGRLSRDDDA